MDIKRIIGRLTKVDEATRRVYGVFAQEVVDRSGEIMDYGSAKKYFQDWSDDLSKASGGKNLGNVRVMHTTAVAAGRVVSMNFNDLDKSVEGCVEIDDENEWQKCLKGTYTGFSIGGRYLKKWADAIHKGVTRYTPQPFEVSLVDLPCIPTATFEIAKADGSVIEANFMSYSPSNDDVKARATDMAKASGKDGAKYTDYVLKAREALIAEHEADVLKAAAATDGAGQPDESMGKDGMECAAGGEGDNGTGTDSATVKKEAGEGDDEPAAKAVDPLAALDEAIAKADAASATGAVDTNAGVADVSGALDVAEKTIWDDLSKASEGYMALQAQAVTSGLVKASRMPDLLGAFAEIQQAPADDPDFATKIKTAGDLLVAMSREDLAGMVVKFGENPDFDAVIAASEPAAKVAADVRADADLMAKATENDTLAKAAVAENVDLADKNDALTKALVEKAVPQIELLSGTVTTLAKTLEDLRASHADELAKRDELHQTALSDLEKRLSAVEDTPVRKTAGSGHALAKEHDGGSAAGADPSDLLGKTDVVDQLAAMTPYEQNRALIKAALRNPQTLIER